MSDAILRRLARDQWVRVNGTPRVTILVGGKQAERLWHDWLDATGLHGVLLASEGDPQAAITDAVHRAIASPAVPIAVRCSRAQMRSWRAIRDDRFAAIVDEGLLEIPEDDGAVHHQQARAPGPGRTASARGAGLRARSAAEAELLKALEATPATAGRFEINGYLSVRFGSNAVEVDLLGRRDRIAIEIDGYYHFGDLEAYRRDRRKDLLLQTQGFLVLRVLAQDVMRDPQPALNAVCQALAYRR